jgi:hypothetical protein
VVRFVQILTSLGPQGKLKGDLGTTARELPGFADFQCIVDELNSHQVWSDGEQRRRKRQEKGGKKKEEKKKKKTKKSDCRQTHHNRFHRVVKGLEHAHGLGAQLQAAPQLVGAGGLAQHKAKPDAAIHGQCDALVAERVLVAHNDDAGHDVLHMTCSQQTVQRVR